MRKNKVVQLVFSLMGNLKIKNKKIRYIVMAILGLLLAFTMQMPEGMFGNDIEKLPNTATTVQKVIEKEANNAISDVIGGFLKNIF